MLQNAKQSSDFAKFHNAEIQICTFNMHMSDSCTGSRKSHPTALIHAPCAFIRVNGARGRPPGHHHKDPPMMMMMMMMMYAHAILMHRLHEI